MPRWQLGRQLTMLRERAGKSLNDVARQLGCSLKTARRMERGEVGVSRGDLLVLLGMYGIEDEEDRAVLLELQSLGRQRAWWSSLGALPENNTLTLLEFESAAIEMRIFEPMVVPGLFQTEEYARATTEGVGMKLTRIGVSRVVEVRMARQEHLLRGGDRPEIQVIVDETVLRRPVGGPEVHRRQLERLAEAVESQIDLFQVVPLAVGSYPGMAGPFIIFEFGKDIREPVVYTEDRSGNHFFEDSKDVRDCSDAFARMREIALSPADSQKLLLSLLEK